MEMENFTEKYIDLLKSALCSSLYEESAWLWVEGPLLDGVAAMSWPKRIIARSKRRVLAFLHRRNLAVVRMLPFDPLTREHGRDWPLFGFTMTGRRRLDALQRCIDDILEKNVPGDLIETGVWRGGSVIFMKALLDIRMDENRIIWCADSFEGMPVPMGVDTKIKALSNFSDRKFLAVSLEQVKKNFEKFRLLDDRVKFLKGWFSDTLPTAPIESLSLLRLDGDLYESTRDALVNLYHKVSPGGYVIIDDYNSWRGCYEAVNDFRKERGISEPMEEVDFSCVLWQVGPGQCPAPDIFSLKSES